MTMLNQEGKTIVSLCQQELKKKYDKQYIYSFAILFIKRQVLHTIWQV